MGISLLPKRREKSAFSIDYVSEYEKGIRGVIFDIDNTLVPHDAPADARARALVQKLKDMGFQVCILSNNEEPRVRTFAEGVSAPYVFKAGKPKKAGYVKAMEIMGTTLSTTLFIGDQILTDVWGANRIGMPHVLTEPIDRASEPFHITLKRSLEKIILFFGPGV